jgi:outer membrane protein
MPFWGERVMAAGAEEPGLKVSIGDSYDLALKNHEKIKIAEKEVAKSRLLPYKAFSLMLPHAEAIGAYKMVRSPITSSLGRVVIVPKDQTLGDLRISNALVNPEFLPQRRKAHEIIDKNVSNYLQVIQNVLGEVALQYYQILRGRDLMKNAEELIKVAQEEVRASKVKLNSGAVTQEVMYRAELDMAAAETRFIDAANFLRLSKDNLKNLVSLKTGSFDVMEPARLPDAKDNYESMVSQAMEYRYDHKMAMVDVELAKTEVTLVKAKFMPSVESSLDYYAVKHPAFDQRSNNWGFMVTGRVPLAEGGLRALELREKQESLQQANLALEDKRRSIRMEVEDALTTAQKTKTLLYRVQRQVDLAQKSYDIIFSKFKFGAATILEVSQAFATLDAAKTDQINKTYDHQVALLQLDKAKGTFVMEQVKSASPAVRSQ